LKKEKRLPGELAGALGPVAWATLERSLLRQLPRMTLRAFYTEFAAKRTAAGHFWSFLRGPARRAPTKQKTEKTVPTRPVATRPNPTEDRYQHGRLLPRRLRRRPSRGGGRAVRRGFDRRRMRWRCGWRAADCSEGRPRSPGATRSRDGLMTGAPADYDGSFRPAPYPPDRTCPGSPARRPRTVFARRATKSIVAGAAHPPVRSYRNPNTTGPAAATR